MSCSVGLGRCFAVDANSSLLLLNLIYAIVAQHAFEMLCPINMERVQRKVIIQEHKNTSGSLGEREMLWKHMPILHGKNSAGISLSKQSGFQRIGSKIVFLKAFI